MCFQNSPHISRSFPEGGRASIMRWLIGFNKTCVAVVPTLTDIADFASVGFPLGYNQICDFPVIVKVDGSVFISVDQMKTWVVIYDPSATGGIEVATTLWWAGAIGALPTGWLFADGSAISRATYADLFAIIDVDYGVGDGSTTFNLPDLRGKSAMGVNDSTLEAEDLSLSTRNVADYVGTETHTLIEDELPSHVHPLRGSPYYWVPSASDQVRAEGSASVTSSTGGDAAHNNMQISLSLYPIIKT